MRADSGRLNWGKLLTDVRWPKAATERSSPKGDTPQWLVASRTETERDFDRILFAAPTRRLGDKTQVFPLEKNESVRTRLTHSHEVANLARSIGTYLINGPEGRQIIEEAVQADPTWTESDVRRAVPAILAAIGLAHDLGNPPFGHQGEAAIQSWVARNQSKLFEDGAEDQAVCKGLTSAHRQDFLKFDGNAQTLRTVTRLQVVKDDRGLNLTFGTLAALMKYTVSSDCVEAETDGVNVPASRRKVGFFVSEAPLVQRIRTETGLAPGHARHPLTHLLEACDDIAFLIVDAEDAVKKQIVSFNDLIAWLESRSASKDDDLINWVLRVAKIGAEQARASKLPPAEVNDVSMQIFRANAITAMVSAVIGAFNKKYNDIMTGRLEEPLLDVSIARAFAKEMKEFDKQHAYSHRRVLEIELAGYNTVSELLDMLWRGITERVSLERVESSRESPFARYAYGRISENYRRVFEGRLPSTGGRDADLPIRYRELQLLTDMIAGMTDQYAIDLHRELREFHVGASAR
jgi:dGTPase